MKQSISILGCGWLGEALAKYLLKQGFQIKASSTSESKLQKLRLIGLKPFLINIESFSANIKDFLNSDILIVAVTSKSITGFKELIHQIENASIRKIIFISSTSVYNNSNEILTENLELNTSLLAEIEQLFVNHPGFLTTVIRFGGLFGYNRKPGNFFSPSVKIKNPNAYVNMIHQDDCILIIVNIIKKEIWNETFNACADSHPCRRDFYTKAALDIGLDIPKFEESENFENKIISNQKLKNFLSFEFKYPDLMDIKENENDVYIPIT